VAPILLILWHDCLTGWEAMAGMGWSWPDLPPGSASGDCYVYANKVDKRNRVEWEFLKGLL